MWDAIASFDNLWEAARLARRSKRFTHSAALFDRNLGPNLLRLLDELQSGEYRPAGYTTFTIYEPGRRLISAAPYRDRVVHHALCRVIEPLFERSFIFDSYANRPARARTPRWTAPRPSPAAFPTCSKGTSASSSPVSITGF